MVETRRGHRGGCVSAGCTRLAQERAGGAPQEGPAPHKALGKRVPRRALWVRQKPSRGAEPAGGHEKAERESAPAAKASWGPHRPLPGHSRRG